MLEQQKKLDAMAYERFKPSQIAPSPQLAEFYSNALTEPGVGEVGPHPRAASESHEPLLHLGDLFFKDQTHDMLAVINAACDLEYAPGTKRKFPKDLAILLLHGQLQRYEEIDTSGALRTELFKHDSRAYRILWDHRRVTSKQYGEVADWLRTEGYSRKARLALPYALQLQQAFAMQMMRIGTPIRPPQFRHFGVEVYCEGDDGNYITVGQHIGDGALIIRRRMEGHDADEDLFVLTVDCILRILGSLDTVIETCNRRKARLASEASSEQDSDEAKKITAGKMTGIDGELVKLEQLKHLSQEWLPMVQVPRPLPRAGKNIEVNPKLLWVYLDRTFAGKYSEGPPIVLNIISEKPSDGTTTVAPLAPAATPPHASPASQEMSND